MFRFAIQTIIWYSIILLRYVNTALIRCLKASPSYKTQMLTCFLWFRQSSFSEKQNSWKFLAPVGNTLYFLLYPTKNYKGVKFVELSGHLTGSLLWTPHSSPNSSVKNAVTCLHLCDETAPSSRNYNNNNRLNIISSQ